MSSSPLLLPHLHNSFCSLLLPSLRSRRSLRYNWSTGYKSFVALQMSLLTFAVYIGSSIYSAGIAGPNPDSITKHFNASETTALVGLTVFIIGYGIGPMVWAPLSEFPQIGRLPVCEYLRLISDIQLIRE